MARNIERSRMIGLWVCFLALGPAFAQADKSDRRSVDLDGDGRASQIEELLFNVWIEYLPELAEDALAAGIPNPNGTLDISGFLEDRQAKALAGLGGSPPIEGLMLALDDPCAFIRGDANRDGALDLADVTFILD